MKIEIWTDFTCPYCYIGKRRLEQALDQFGQQDYIEIEYKSYELDPNAASDCEETKQMMLMRKYGMTSEQAIEMTEKIIVEAKDIGLEFQIDNVTHTNTFHAHRLVKYAMQYNKHHDIVERLFEKYFVHKHNIGHRDVLLNVAADIGLDVVEIDELLCLNKFGKKVRLDEEVAEEIGITTVPFFIFNETYAISGAQSAEMFLDLLYQLREESDEPNLKKKKKSGNRCCVGNECEIE